VTLPARGWTQLPISNLLPGVAIPADATLEVVPIAGTVDLYSSVVDNGTGHSVITAGQG